MKRNEGNELDTKNYIEKGKQGKEENQVEIKCDEKKLGAIETEIY